jgi:hypothetical protein
MSHIAKSLGLLALLGLLAACSATPIQLPDDPDDRSSGNDDPRQSVDAGQTRVDSGIGADATAADDSGPIGNDAASDSGVDGDGGGDTDGGGDGADAQAADAWDATPSEAGALADEDGPTADEDADTQ